MPPEIRSALKGVKASVGELWVVSVNRYEGDWLALLTGGVEKPHSGWSFVGVEKRGVERVCTYAQVFDTEAALVAGVKAFLRSVVPAEEVPSRK
jgi:hypothetical protein